MLTNRGEPVAEVVPYGTPIRKKGKPILGMFEVEDYTQPWDEEGVSEQVWEDRERAARIAEQETRFRRRNPDLLASDSDGSVGV